MGSRDAYNRSDRRWTPTQRQREVLDLLVEGATNAEIAVRLGISVDGAKWHVGELLSQTGCGDRLALASWWLEERTRARGTGILAWLRFGSVARGLAAAGIGLAAAVVAVSILAGGSPEASELADGPPPTATPRPSPTPWPDEALEALAASQSAPPANCEPPEAQDMRIVTAADLLAEGLEPAGRVVVAPYCPLYVANRADRTVLWVGGGGIIHFDSAGGHRLMSVDRCCMAGFLSVGGFTYHVSGYGYEAGSRLPFREGFAPIDASNGRVGSATSTGSYLMLSAREGGAGVGAVHRLAVSTDGWAFIDPEPEDTDTVLNDLTGEKIDLSALTPIGSVRSGNTGVVSTDCWAEEAVCSVYLDGLGGEGAGVFNPASLPAPVDGVLRCVSLDGAYWSIDGPALGYELDAGDFRLVISAFGGYWEEWDGGCPSRDVAAGEELDAWVYTRIEAFAADGTPISIVSTRGGRLFVGEVELLLDCPCEYRS